MVNKQKLQVRHSTQCQNNKSSDGRGGGESIDDQATRREARFNLSSQLHASYVAVKSPDGRHTQMQKKKARTVPNQGLSPEQGRIFGVLFGLLSIDCGLEPRSMNLKPLLEYLLGRHKDPRPCKGPTHCANPFLLRALPCPSQIAGAVQVPAMRAQQKSTSPLFRPRSSKGYHAPSTCSQSSTVPTVGILPVRLSHLSSSSGGGLLKNPPWAWDHQVECESPSLPEIRTEKSTFVYEMCRQKGKTGNGKKACEKDLRRAMTPISM